MGVTSAVLRTRRRRSDHALIARSADPAATRRRPRSPSLRDGMSGRRTHHARKALHANAVVDPERHRDVRPHAARPDDEPELIPSLVESWGGASERKSRFSRAVALRRCRGSKRRPRACGARTNTMRGGTRDQSYVWQRGTPSAWTPGDAAVQGTYEGDGTAPSTSSLDPGSAPFHPGRGGYTGGYGRGRYTGRRGGLGDGSGIAFGSTRGRGFGVPGSGRGGVSRRGVRGRGMSTSTRGGGRGQGRGRGRGGTFNTWVPPERGPSLASATAPSMKSFPAGSVCDIPADLERRLEEEQLRIKEQKRRIAEEQAFQRKKKNLLRAAKRSREQSEHRNKMARLHEGFSRAAQSLANGKSATERLEGAAKWTAADAAPFVPAERPKVTIADREAVLGILACLNDYEVLQCSLLSDASSIRKSYHRLSRMFHPDKCKAEGAKDAFQRISKAYKALMSTHS